MGDAVVLQQCFSELQQHWQLLRYWQNISVTVIYMYSPLQTASIHFSSLFRSFVKGEDPATVRHIRNGDMRALLRADKVHNNSN